MKSLFVGSLCVLGLRFAACGEKGKKGRADASSLKAKTTRAIDNLDRLAKGAAVY